jgi:hypothetical protein
MSLLLAAAVAVTTDCPQYQSLLLAAIVTREDGFKIFRPLGRIRSQLYMPKRTVTRCVTVELVVSTVASVRFWGT